jgi:hypothetical protein
MNHHTVAAIALAGCFLDVLGSLYLAYDLLGGPHGPLRLLTRCVTYSLIYGIGYGLGLGLFFGIISGLAFGSTSSVELNRLARGRKPFSLGWRAFFSALRGLALAIGLYPITGKEFAAIFGVIIAAGQVGGYMRGIAPGMDYASELRPRLTRRQFWTTVQRTIGFFATALLCGAIVHHVNWHLAILIGLVTGLVTGVAQTVYSYIEYYADNLPSQWLGAFGIALILCGFVLQSVQYWLTLFDVRVV